MSGIVEIVQQQLTGGVLQQISKELGLDPAATQQAVSAALPVVLGGMAKHASNPEAAAAIHQEADNHSTPADMTGISNILAGQGGAGALLGAILGSNQQSVQSGVSQTTGLDLQKAGRLVAMLAPFVLAAISNKKQVDGLQPTQVAGTLTQAQQTAQAEAQRQSPQLGGILGSVMSEVMNRQ
jgi:hypothetical protein